MHSGTGEIRHMTDSEIEALVERDKKWTQLSKEELSYLEPMSSGLRPQTLKQMRLKTRKPR